jgi:Zn-finger nucleic acid-binding protein
MPEYARSTFFLGRLPMDNNIVIACPECGNDLKVYPGLSAFQTTCHRCGRTWDWPTGRANLDCPKCAVALQLPIAENILYGNCPKCGVRWAWLRESNTVTGKVARQLAALSRSSVMGCITLLVTLVFMRLPFVLVILVSLTPAVVCFYVGKWLKEEKLRTQVVGGPNWRREEKN